jgi:nitrogen fixation NifU-like protein
MSELNDLYQEVILDHNKNPRNFREITTANFTADGNNPCAVTR